MPTLFISSCHKGMADYRILAERAIHNIELPGGRKVIALRTETGGAAPLPPLAECIRRVNASDLVIVIVGFRYGSPVPDDERGRSYTEAEFDEAVRSGTPLIVLVARSRAAVSRDAVDADQKLINRFRRRIEVAQDSGGYMIQFFNNAINFEDLIRRSLSEHLPAITTGAVRVAPDLAENIRLPTELRPPFYGMTERRLFGRDEILAQLDDWYRDLKHSALMLRAEGGMGKSSVTWWWFERVEDRCPEVGVAGFFWFSFYQTGHSLREFANQFRRWLEPHIPEDRRRPEASDWTAIDVYCRCLVHQPLIVLDGLEAEFVGYEGRRPGRQDDDDAGVGSQFQSVSSADEEELDSDADRLDVYADFLDEKAGRGLVDLIKSRAAKILISTRETPSSFIEYAVAETGMIGGLKELRLTEVDVDSAQKLLVDVGVEAQQETFTEILKLPALRHPLLLVTFGRAVKGDDLANGNLDTFLEKYPEQDLREYLKKGRGSGRKHILYFATRELSEVEEYLLSIITVTDSPISSELVFGVAENNKGYRSTQIKAALENLKTSRALIYASRHTRPNDEGTETYYSMHPIYRLYWKRLNLAQVRENAANIDEDFEKNLFAGYGRSVTETTPYDVYARILPVVGVSLLARKYTRAWDLLQGLLHCHERFGLYRTLHQELSEFITFEERSDRLLARCLIESPEKANIALKWAAESFRLFDQNEESQACSRALVDILRQRKQKKGSEARNISGSEICVLQVEASLFLSLLETSNAYTGVKLLTEILDRAATEPEIEDGAHFLTIVAQSAAGDFGHRNDRELTALLSFAAIQNWKKQSRVDLSWVTFSRPYLRNYATDELLEEYFRLAMVFDDKIPRHKKLLSLWFFDYFANRGELELAQAMHEYASALGDWDELDLGPSIDIQKVIVSIVGMEASGYAEKEEIERVDKAIDAYEIRYAKRLSMRRRLGLALYRLRLHVLEASTKSPTELEEVLTLVAQLKPPKSASWIEHLVRCGIALNREAVVEGVIGSLPERYEIEGLIPDPIFGFKPDPNRIGPRPWATELDT